MARFTSDEVDLYVMGRKGLSFLRGVFDLNPAPYVKNVVCGRDSHVISDFHEDIAALAKSKGVEVVERKISILPTFQRSKLAMAAGWRWKIDNYEMLAVVHDSLLPKYRGFNPLVSALIEGERRIGVSAIIATPLYDRGDIIAQIPINIDFPITVESAIKLTAEKYQELGAYLGTKIRSKEVFDVQPQNEAESSYSVWRDDDDYWVNWSWSSEKIRRFVDATGFPYLGARALAGDREVILQECEEVQDVVISNRDPGKVLFMNGNAPVVICGAGLLSITSAIFRDTRESCLGQLPFRTRFIKKHNW